MNFIQMQQLIVSWYRDGTIDHVRPVIAGRLLIGFEIGVLPEHVPVEATHEESVRLLRTFNFNKSNYYSAQLVTPKARGVGGNARILPEYRNARPSPIVGGEELEEYIQAIGRMQIGDKLEIAYGAAPQARNLKGAAVQGAVPEGRNPKGRNPEPKPRVTMAVNRAAEQLGYTIQFLAGNKGVMRIERLG